MKSQKSLRSELRARAKVKSQKYGFSLMELLVVIGIMAILISIGFSSFTTAQKKTRDSKRKSDVKEIQNALEQYYSVCGYEYPTPPVSYFTAINCPTPPISIMPTVPLDPKSTPYSCPASDCTKTGYKICATLESESSNTFCLPNQQ